MVSTKSIASRWVLRNIEKVEKRARLKDAYTEFVVSLAENRVRQMMESSTEEQLNKRKIRKISFLGDYHHGRKTTPDALLVPEQLELHFKILLRKNAPLEYWVFLVGHEVGHTFEYRTMEDRNGVRLKNIIAPFACPVSPQKYEELEDVRDVFSLLWLSQGNNWESVRRLLVDEFFSIPKDSKQRHFPFYVYY